jgi:hypothetical protein
VTALGKGLCEISATPETTMLGGTAIGIGAKGEQASFRVTYKAPAADGVLSLKSAQSLILFQTGGDAEVSVPAGRAPTPEQYSGTEKAISMMTAADLLASTDTADMIVYLPKPKSATDAYAPTAKFELRSYAADGSLTTSADCPDVSAKIQAAGQGCACKGSSLVGSATSVGDLLGNLLSLGLFATPFVFRRRSEKM